MPEAARATPESISALPTGTRLGEFEIRSLLGVGGFGIVYLAFDHALEREVAIKEYMPASMAGRTETLHVSLRSKSDTEVFALGLKSFVNEARLLARFDHPSLIKVHRFWQGNGTAYMAMPVLRGQTLKELRRRHGRCPEEAWIRAMLPPLLGALERLHQAGVYHRDISPDNIQVEADGRPVLLDFGAARHVIGGKTHALTAILKPAYAPIEQFGETDMVRQGPWTDLYALGATLHYLLLGHPPAPATARMVSNEGAGLAPAAVPGCSPELLAMVDWMLAPRPAERPQSVADLMAVVERRAPVPPHILAAPPPDAASRLNAARAAPHAVTVPLEEVRSADLALDLLDAAHDATPPRRVHGRAALAPAQATSVPAETLAMAADDAHRLPPPPARSRALPLVLAVAALAGAVGYFGWRMRTAADAVAAPVPAASAAISPSAAAAPSAPSAPPAPDAAETAASATMSMPVAASAAAAAPEATSTPMQAGAGALPVTAQAASASAAAALHQPAPPRPRATSPSTICRGRNELSHYICMERECARPAFSNLPECQAARLQAAPRDAARP